MKKKFSLRKTKPSPEQGRKLGSQSNFGKDSDGAKIKKVTEEQLLDDEQRNPPDATTDWLEFTSTGNFRESSSNNNNNNVGNKNDDVLFDESGTDWMDRVIDNDIMGGKLSKESFSVSNRKRSGFSPRKRETLAAETSNSDSDDIFDDLNIPADEEVDIKRILNNMLTLSEDSSSQGKSEEKQENGQEKGNKSAPISLEDYMDLSSSRKSTVHESAVPKVDQSSDLPIDPSHLKNAKGILIFDPEKNGIYHMDEDNKSLTNKDLLIIGKQQEEVGDDQTLMSNLTEVTYKKSKEERMRLIMDHLQNAAKTLPVPESSAWCGGWENPFNIDEPDKVDRIEDNIHNDRITRIATNTSSSAPWDASLLLRSVMALSTGGEKVDIGSFSEKICVCITRIYLALQENPEDDNGLRCISKEPKLSHDLGVNFTENLDGQAIVNTVIKGSTAYRSGVRVGDVLSFAVPLNNTFQGYERACDFISRLEVIGMRTSYREFFDMFLSNTSAGWPIAIVFRRQSEAIQNADRLPFGLPSLDLNVDIKRATSFLHEIVTKSREFDHQRECNGIHEIIRGNIENFIPRSSLRDVRLSEKIRMEVSLTSPIPFVPTVQRDDKQIEIIHPSVRRSNLLTWFAESACGIFYVRCITPFVGSGLIITRNQDRTWSTPCAIGGKVFCSNNFNLTSGGMECVVFIRSNDIVSEFKTKKKVDITTDGNNVQNNGSMHSCIVKSDNSLFCDYQASFSLYVRGEVNKEMYKVYTGANLPSQILSGILTPPAETIGLFGALRRFEVPSTMYPHPTPPSNLLKYTSFDWSKNDSCLPSEPLEPPFDEDGSLSLRDLLNAYANGFSMYEEESREFDIFTLKFKQMLFDGVTVDRIWSAEELRLADGRGNGSTSDTTSVKVLVKLSLSPEESLKKGILHFVTKQKVSEVQYENKSVFRDPIASLDENEATDIISLKGIVFISQRNKKKKKKFVSIITKDGKTVTFFARTGKDAALLCCGLKLLVERCLRE